MGMKVRIEKSMLPVMVGKVGEVIQTSSDGGFYVKFPELYTQVIFFMKLHGEYPVRYYPRESVTILGNEIFTDQEYESLWV